MDLLNVVIRADTTGADKSTAALEKMTAGARQADAAIKSLGQASPAYASIVRGADAAAAANHRLAAATKMAAYNRAGLATQLVDVGQTLALGMNPLMVAMQQGPQIFSMYGNSLAGVGAALKDVAGMAVSAARTLAPLGAIAGAATILLQGMTNEINAVSGANVSLMDTTLAVFESIASGVQIVLGPAMSWLQTDWDNAVNQIFSDTAREVNAIIGLWVGSVDAIKAAWGNLPAALGYIVYEASKTTVNNVIYMIRSVQETINRFLSSIDGAIVKMGGKASGIGMDLLPYVLDPNPHQDGAAAAGAAGAAFNAAQGKDYVGDWMGGIGTRAQEIAAARAATEELGSAADAANGKVAKLLDQGLGNLTHWTTSFGEAAKSAFSNLGSGIIDALKKGGDIASNVLNMLMDKVGQFGETLLNNGLNGLLNAGLGALGSMFGGGTWGVAGGFAGHAGIFGIPGMATGGTVGRAGLSWVGEQGPELLRLPQGAQVIPNGPSMAVAANQNGMGVVIHNQINVAAGTDPAAAPAIAREVAKEIRRQIPDAIEAYNRNPHRRAS